VLHRTAAEVAVSRKEEKYADVDSHFLFESIVVETLGVFNSSANSLLNEIGGKVSLNTRESRKASFLYQCISVLVPLFIAILLHDSLPTGTLTEGLKEIIIHQLLPEFSFLASRT